MSTNTTKDGTTISTVDLLMNAPFEELTMTRPIHADVALKAAEPLVLEPARNSSLAVASLVLGIASWLGFSFLASLPAVVTGHIAMNRIKTAGGTLTGDGMATAGLIIGYLNIWVSFFLLGLLTTILSSILRKLT